MRFVEHNGETRLETLGTRSLAAWEIVSVVSSTVIAEWGVMAVAGDNKLLIAVPVSLAFIYMFLSHRAHGESARDLGWRVDNFMHAGGLLLVPMLLVTILFILVGWFRSELRIGGSRAGWSILGMPVWGFAWGLMQQYVLQGFINRRAQILWGRGVRSVLLVACIFATLHLPNPSLTITTFVGGIVWAAVYQRAPNLFALALSHTFMTWVLISTIPDTALRGLRVGYKYFG